MMTRSIDMLVTYSSSVSRIRNVSSFGSDILRQLERALLSRWIRTIEYSHRFIYMNLCICLYSNFHLFICIHSYVYHTFTYKQAYSYSNRLHRCTYDSNSMLRCLVPDCFVGCCSCPRHSTKAPTGMDRMPTRLVLKISGGIEISMTSVASSTTSWVMRWMPGYFQCTMFYLESKPRIEVPRARQWLEHDEKHVLMHWFETDPILWHNGSWCSLYRDYIETIWDSIASRTGPSNDRPDSIPEFCTRFNLPILDVEQLTIKSWIQSRLPRVEGGQCVDGYRK